MTKSDHNVCLETTTKGGDKMTETMQYRMLTVPEVAKILGVGRASAYNLVKQPGFPSVQIGRQIRIPEKGLYRWIDSHVAV